MDAEVLEPPNSDLDAALAGLDALDVVPDNDLSRPARLWAGLWPKVLAVAAVLAFWQLVVWSHWKPAYLLPGPGPVLGQLWHDLLHADLLGSVGITLRRAATGYGLSIIIGMVLGAAVVRSKLARTAFGSLITGLQTMPSIAWFPLAILLFQLSEKAILFVIILGAAPAIANGLIGGVDHIPPIMLKAGRVLGARRLTMWRHVILPASLPGLTSGLKQAWAFAWRSLMAGELVVPVGHRLGLGTRLSNAQQLLDSKGLLADMVTILIVGIVVDTLVFGRLERSVRIRWGLTRR